MIIVPHIPTVPFNKRKSGNDPEFYDPVCEKNGETIVCSSVLNQKVAEHQQSFEGMWLVFVLALLGGIAFGFFAGRWMLK